MGSYLQTPKTRENARKGEGAQKVIFKKWVQITRR